MDLKKLIQSYNEIISKIDEDSEEGLKHFIKVWSNLDYEEKDILKAILIKYVLVTYGEMKAVTDIQFYWAAVLNETKEEYQNNNRNQKLVLNDKIKDVQVAKLFYEMKSRNYLDNTLEEIAVAISNLFGFKFNTIFSYLNEPKRMEKANELF